MWSNRQLGQTYHSTAGRLSAVLAGLVLPFALLLAVLVLSACNSGSLSDGLESAARPQPTETVGQEGLGNPNQGQVALDPTPGGVTTAGGQTPGNQATNTQTAALPTGNPVAFLPVSNAPQNAVTTLAQSIRDSASRNGVRIVASVEQGAQYQVKGYFSALEDGSGTLLVYVWDVLDRNNKRIYRINGQEQASARSANPWDAVTPAMLNRVADSTIVQLKTWLAGR